MILRALLGATALSGMLISDVSAQDYRDHPLLPVIAEHESQGRNIPNFRYDKGHTAAGHYQITDTNWRIFAPQLDIDIEKYPNALSAPEQLQGQVAGLMVAREGVLPWTCCNEKLRQIFDQPNPAVVGRKVARAVAPAANAAPVEPPRGLRFQWQDAGDTGDLVENPSTIIKAAQK